jgi:hypothetical protein
MSYINNNKKVKNIIIIPTTMYMNEESSVPQSLFFPLASEDYVHIGLPLALFGGRFLQLPVGTKYKRKGRLELSF